ncbi:hypothetical protein NicSoilE8_27210 [Arthrobacter sp. NicSoilE8]|nr:hypothetical protein NicSoilE8_27210 [Arthrobacter sp. NicSoilE8]
MTHHSKTFTTWPQHYAKNYSDGENLRVVPARIKYSEDGETPGVVVFVHNKVTLVLTTEHAYNLANGIADALEEGRNAA